jgi:hypothetical protein
MIWKKEKRYMYTLARITAIVLIILGILVLLGGLAAGVTGAVRTGTRALGAAPAQGGPRLGGLLSGFALGVFLFIQGLMIIAMGEGLFLLAGLSKKAILPST